MKRSFRKSGEYYFRPSLREPPLTAYRTIMIAGHETTAKAVGTLSSATFFCGPYEFSR